MRALSILAIACLAAPGVFAAPAINLASNTGATIRFGGGMTLATTSETAFNATGGGTVEVTGANNTVSSTTGTALNVAGTTIGANDMTFQSISSGTGASGPTNGIVLNSTGSNGGLNVTGDGGGSNNGSGGKIQNTTGAGVALTSTQNVSLSHMDIEMCASNGIAANGVVNLALNRLNVLNNGTGVVSHSDEGLSLRNVTGNVSLSSTLVQGSSHFNAYLENDTGTLASFTLTDSQIVNAGGSGILFEARGTAVVTTATVSDSSFTDNQVIGLHVIAGDSANIQNFVVSNNQFADLDPDDGFSQQIGVDFSKSQVSNVNFSIINNNTFMGHNSHALNVFTGAGADTGGSMTGTIDGNVIGDSNVDGSGSRIGNGIRVNLNGQSADVIMISNNVVRECPVGRGIEVMARNGTGGADVSVLDNDVDHINLPFDPMNGSEFPLAAIFLQSNCVTVCNSLRSDVRGNTVPSGTAFDLTIGHITLLQTNSSSHQLLDTAPASANATAQLTENNTGSADTGTGVSLFAGPVAVP